MTDSELRVVLADDQPLVLSGISAILNAQPGISVVGTAKNGQDAVELVTETRPDVVCLDIEMPVMNGIDAAAAILAVAETEVIMLTTFNREDYLIDALRAGASGFLLKDATPEELVQAVRVVGEGEALLSPRITRTLIADYATRPAVPVHNKSLLAELTDRELDVMRLVSKGLPNAEIAAELFLAEQTVKTHVSRILSKLSLRDRTQIVVTAYESGLVRAGE